MKTRYFIVGGLLAAAVALSGPVAPAQAGASNASRSAAWVRAFASPGPPSTVGSGIGRASLLIRAPQFASLLEASFPQKQWFWYDHSKLTPLPDLMQLFMGVPGNVILDESRYVTLDGCLAHVCDADRGMLWIDTGADPADLIFAGIDLIGGKTPDSESHLWIFTSRNLNWQHTPAPFVSSLHRWLATIGTDPYFGTDGYHYKFAIVTVVQPNGVMVDLGPGTFSLGAAGSKTISGTGI